MPYTKTEVGIHEDYRGGRRPGVARPRVKSPKHLMLDPDNILLGHARTSARGTAST